MPRFSVPITRNVTETADVIVECDHIEQAEQLAIEAARGDPSAYNFKPDDESAQVADYYMGDSSLENIEECEPLPQMHECQDCGQLSKEEDLRPIEDLHQRVAAGELMPSGECQWCGALCHPTDKQWPEWEVKLIRNECGNYTFKLRAPDADTAAEDAQELLEENEVPDDGVYDPVDGDYTFDSVTEVTP